MAFDALGMHNGDRGNWQCLISSLQAVGFFFDPMGDRIVWGGSSKGTNIYVKDLYQHLKAKGHTTSHIPGFSKVWKWKIPHKITLFNWLLRKGKILTWENLQKREKHGPR